MSYPTVLWSISRRWTSTSASASWSTRPAREEPLRLCRSEQAWNADDEADGEQRDAVDTAEHDQSYRHRR